MANTHKKPVKELSAHEFGYELSEKMIERLRGQTLTEAQAYYLIINLVQLIHRTVRQ